MSDPLERRMVPCDECHGKGHKPWSVQDNTGIHSGKTPCHECDGTGLIPEPAEVWAERNARIARWLADRDNRCRPENCIHCTGFPSKDDCITARIIVAEKGARDART